MLGDVADDKQLEEKLLEASNLPWTVIKAVILNDSSVAAYQKMDFSDYHP